MASQMMHSRERLRWNNYASRRTRLGDFVPEALVLVTLTRGPVQRLFCLSAPLASKYRQSAIRRWLTSLVCLS